MPPAKLDSGRGTQSGLAGLSLDAAVGQQSENLDTDSDAGSDTNRVGVPEF